jgi:hypothetical protein
MKSLQRLVGEEEEVEDCPVQTRPAATESVADERMVKGCAAMVGQAENWR